MTLVELKKSLHEKIDSLEDSDYLEMLDSMISEKDEIFIKIKKAINSVGQTSIKWSRN
jgi:phage shock protein A